MYYIVLMEREYFIKKTRFLFKNHKVVAILGPRQVGKTTLSEMFAEEEPEVHKYDLEDPKDLKRLEKVLSHL